MNKRMIALAGLAAAAFAPAAWAKMPPMSDEAKAKAEETKAKAAWSDKVAAYQLCLSQDKVAAYYRKNKPSVAVGPTGPATGALATTPVSAPAAGTAAPAAGTGASAAAATAPAAGTTAPAAGTAAPAAGTTAPAAGTAAPPAAAPAAVAAAPAPAAIPPCQDPGPYVAAAQSTGQVGVADSKPVPAAGKPAAPAEAKK